MEKINNVKAGERKRSIKKEYETIFTLKPINPETKIGEAVDVVYSKETYSRLIKGLLPRWNKLFAPMRWIHSSAFNQQGKRVIRIQRVS